MRKLKYFCICFPEVPFLDDVYWPKIACNSKRKHTMSLTYVTRVDAIAAMGCSLSDLLALVHLNPMCSFSFPPAIPPLVQEITTFKPQT